MTRQVALIGKPLKRRHSQVMHDAAFDACGIDARYVLREIEPDEVEGVVTDARGDGWLGLGVTAPYKQVVAGLVDEVEGDAQTIGAVNNVVRGDDGRLIGFNSDAPGFRAGVELAMGRSLRGAEVVVAGAGGAAHAVVFALLMSGVTGITVGARSTDAARDLVDRFATVGGGDRAVTGLGTGSFHEALGSADLAVNATTVGMVDPGMTIPVEELPDHATVFDLVYVPRGNATARGSARPRSPRRERLGDAHRPGRHRVRALDRGRRHGRRDARSGRATPRRRDRPRLTDATRDDHRWRPRTRRRGRGRSGPAVRLRSVDAGARCVGVGRSRSTPIVGRGRAAGGLAAARRGDARAGGARSGRDLHDRPELSGRRTRPRTIPIGRRGRSSTARCRPRWPGTTPRLRWDRDVTPNVDAEVELGVVVGIDGGVFGYTIIDDVSSRDAWLDGDQWLLGKSMAGFCPVGPWIVTADEFDPTEIRLGCRLGDAPIQDGSTAAIRYGIDEVLAYLGRHVALQPGDLIATGTPPRLTNPPGPDSAPRGGRRRDVLDRGDR